ncbi:MAG: hypothetical protein GY820_22450 [Gammaproteobacteria bacterium]|nr:hypothetical protein [Gammaproteobacteria bacterium]
MDCMGTGKSKLHCTAERSKEGESNVLPNYDTMAEAKQSNGTTINKMNGYAQTNSHIFALWSIRLLPKYPMLGLGLIFAQIEGKISKIAALREEEGRGSAE